ncbi:MAG: hypothetical protein KIT18_08785 [Burkholderiales bacterium]|nr:hypothetical protein [Burkholderiales bacterium]
MFNIASTTTAAAIALAASLALVAIPAAAQSKGGKIVCWKDKSGKVVGCGDTVPPEYQGSGTRELDRSGVTRKTTESAAAVEKRRALEQEQTKLKAEEQKKAAEQKRQDMALINTYTSEREIDQRRDRDLQQADLQISQLEASLKNAAEREQKIKARHDAVAKTGKPVPDGLKEELSGVAAEKQKLESSIAAREKEKEMIRARYAEQKRRYVELKGGTPSSVPATPTPAAAATKK